MRFQLHHLLAVVTVFAVLLAFAKATGHADRDGVWEIISIEQEERDFTSFDGMGPPLYDYIGNLKDGDRNIRVHLGSSWLTDFEVLPKPGETVEFNQTKTSRPGQSTYSPFFISHRTPIFPRLMTVLVIAGASTALVLLSIVLQNMIVRFAVDKVGTNSVYDEPDDAREPPS
ncbi:hypothetical protein Enr13x_66500 [Stieleria neptunia]|uniref:Uncharacterized protein n=1 Tax=Stieleria neptunia TaxID=2527979 RepID=A0A518I0Y6_9BACT|nr:hypothetical protein [Stieleria neptunia]QDV46741.1 hypothetical protein Enr13x_66500 [Stieleria neptunia]